MYSMPRRENLASEKNSFPSAGRCRVVGGCPGRIATKAPAHVLACSQDPGIDRLRLVNRAELVNAITFSFDAIRWHVMRFALGLDRAPLDADEPLPPQDDLASRATQVLDRIFREERSGLLRFVGRKGRREDAEDVVQQAFARFAARGNADLIENPGAYLRQSATNLLRDNGRVALRNPPIQCGPLEPDEISDCDPIAALESRDRLRRIEAAVVKLKPLTRKIFLARRVYGYSLAEICEQTGLSQKGVERHMGIAIKQLGRHLCSHD